MSNLRDFLVEEQRKGEPGKTVILAGHFAIFSSGGIPEDFLWTEEVPKEAVSMVAFTKATLELACEAQSFVPPIYHSKLVLLADDVTFVRPQLQDRGLSEKLGAELAAYYFRNMPVYPWYHLHTLMHFSMVRSVVEAPQGGYVFRERLLQKEIVDYVRKPSVKNRAGIRAPDRSNVYVRTDEGEQHLVASGNTNCVGSFLGLEKQLIGMGMKKLIAMIPSRCNGRVCTGVSIAPVIGFKGLEVVTISIPEPGTGDMAIVS